MVKTMKNRILRRGDRFRVNKYTNGILSSDHFEELEEINKFNILVEYAGGNSPYLMFEFDGFKIL